MKPEFGWVSLLRGSEGTEVRNKNYTSLASRLIFVRQA
jgi:hypothetical protein